VGERPPASCHGDDRGPNLLRPIPARAGILLDRDGTIIVDRGYVGSPDQVQLIDGATDAIRQFNREGIPVAVVTNQAGVAHGYYGIADVHRVHDHLAAELRRHGAHVDMFLFCPYHPDGVIDAYARHSEDRKPRPGMAIAAARALDLDLTACWVIGDRAEDIGLARTIGAEPIHIGAPLPTGVTSFATLADAAHFVLQRIAA
jgi:histidinol-phosphate phosphatase family protein